jgi:alpha-N-arabinofuranosidase
MKKITTGKSLPAGFRILIAVIVILFIGATVACTQTKNSTFTVDVSKPGPQVAPICRGQQIEEFNYQFEGGLYAQLINNPSFEELKNPISYWTLVKSGSSGGKLVSQQSEQLHQT